MIITRTPYRISFFGGGTDYTTWYEEHGGAVLTATINKYCYIWLRTIPPFFSTKYQVSWSKMEAVDRIDEIEHAGVWGCLQYLKVTEGVDVSHAGEMPARSGLGSSSAFTVGMLNALHTLEGHMASKDELAAEAIAVEQDVLNETVGVQDQIQCAHGGINRITIARDGSYAMWPVALTSDRKSEFASWLILIFTGLQRHASKIAAAQMNNINHKREQLHSIASLVPQGHAALVKGKFEKFGRLLHEGWMLKRQLSDRISGYDIDAIYDRARMAGAIGGKILGAGGGGFMLFCAPPDAHTGIRQALAELISWPVTFEDHGSQVVHHG